ncbi:MAG: phosphonate C-P lyase system protein PhnG [Rhizobiaceae bacterium]|nr:phosphonate C-P lyase system protein PhnG [Rhizobiaceae bacterium]
MTSQTQDDPVVGSYGHGKALDILASSRPANIKAFAEELLETLGDVSVLSNRTGLAMLPFKDTVKGTDFHLGEVLISEAHIRLPVQDVEGYGAIVGRDLEHAMAMAIIDASMFAKHMESRIVGFLDDECGAQEESDRQRLRQVEATRVLMETF